MTKKEETPPTPPGGLEQNGFEKRICNIICALQLISILSGVALLYLSVIVVIPSKQTLDAEFHEEPFICTTLSNKSVKTCDWLSCGEWCLSKGGSCLQIHAKVRRPGSDVKFEDCSEVSARFCSAQQLENTQQFTCSMGDEEIGDCNFLNGFMSCTQVANPAEDINSSNTSLCRNITAISDCSGTKGGSDFPLRPESSPILCSRYTCNDLEGTYECKDGNCRKLENPQCIDRCSNLQMQNMAVVVPDHFHWARCGKAIINGTEVWSATDSPLVIYCSRISNVSETEMHAEDCLNGTLVDGSAFSGITTYKQVLAALQSNSRTLQRNGESLDRELDLMVFNKTRVKINIEGCVNTLRKECTRWLNDKGRDGSSGMHPSVFPCVVTPHTNEYVITNYNREATAYLLMMSIVVPISLMVISCCLLVMCAKAVAVNEYGLFYCKLCHKQTPGAGETQYRPI